MDKNLEITSSEARSKQKMIPHNPPRTVVEGGHQHNTMDTDMLYNQHKAVVEVDEAFKAAAGKRIGMGKPIVIYMWWNYASMTM